MRLILATHNRHKLEEMRSLFAGTTCEWVALDAYPIIRLPEETGTTFEANAQLKAEAIARATGAWALADDSGLCVDALNGMPGVYSARYAGEAGNAARNIAKLLEALRHVPPDRRQASFVAVLVLVGPQGERHVARGECHGVIIDAPRGTGGFGYDPIFFLPHRQQTMAELTPAEKNQCSHRAHAAARMRALIDLLRA